MVMIVAAVMVVLILVGCYLITPSVSEHLWRLLLPGARP